MTKRTLPQPDAACLAVVLDVLATTEAPLSLPLIQKTIRAKHKLTASEIRAAVNALVADERVDSEQFSLAQPRVYFLPSRPPRGAIWTPASQVPRIAPVVPRQPGMSAFAMFAAQHEQLLDHQRAGAAPAAAPIVRPGALEHPTEIAVLEHVKANPNVDVGGIALAINVQTELLYPVMQKLKRTGQICSAGRVGNSNQWRAVVC
jgi:hypothetical protein